MANCNALENTLANTGLQPTPDTQLGGTNDAYNVSGEQTAGATPVAFTRPLAGNGASDTPVQNKLMYLLLAAGQNDGYVCTSMCLPTPTPPLPPFS